MIRQSYIRDVPDDDALDVFRPSPKRIARMCEKFRRERPRPLVGEVHEEYELPGVAKFGGAEFGGVQNRWNKRRE